MNFDEVQEILKAKRAIGYPELSNVRQNPKYADILLNSFAGDAGEFTAISQYIYEHMELDRYNNISKILLSIAEEEMIHLDMLGKLIRKLGKKVYFGSGEKTMWHGELVKYNFNSIYEMILYNIESEQKAIKGYREAIKFTQNKSIKELLERIILDEQTHIEIFNRLK